MSGGNSLFVRADSVDEVRAIIPEWIDVTLDEQCEYARLSNADDWTELATKLSSSGHDVIELGFQSTVDAFRYVRWVNGKPARTLQFGWSHTEREWERVAGVAEEWESVFETAPKVGVFMTLTAFEMAEAAGMHHKLTDLYQPPAKTKKPKKAKKKKKASPRGP
jgi:hypothetical protein